MAGWIGVDLDGTLATYAGWQGADHIGAPVECMISRVKQWIADGIEVRIFTARVSPVGHDDLRPVVISIQAWCLRHIGCELPITHCKDYGMVELWDDRCVQIIPNTGRRADGKS